MALCEEMGILIKNYRPLDKSKKRELEREKEEEVLRLFKKRRKPEEKHETDEMVDEKRG